MKVVAGNAHEICPVWFIIGASLRALGLVKIRRVRVVVFAGNALVAVPFLVVLLARLARRAVPVRRAGVVVVAGHALGVVPDRVLVADIVAGSTVAVY